MTKERWTGGIILRVNKLVFDLAAILETAWNAICIHFLNAFYIRTVSRQNMINVFSIVQFRIFKAAPKYRRKNDKRNIGVEAQIIKSYNLDATDITYTYRNGKKVGRHKKYITSKKSK